MGLQDCSSIQYQMTKWDQQHYWQVFRPVWLNATIWLPFLIARRNKILLGIVIYHSHSFTFFHLFILHSILKILRKWKVKLKYFHCIWSCLHILFPGQRGFIHYCTTERQEEESIWFDWYRYTEWQTYKDNLHYPWNSVFPG